MWADLWNIHLHHFPVIKKKIMSSSFALVCAVRTKRQFISYWTTTPFASVGLITMRSPSQSADTHCASSCYPKQRQLWDFSEMRSHTFANTQSQWKTGIIMSKHTDTVPQKDKVAETRTHLQPRACVVTHIQWYICEHTTQRVDRGIKQKNKQQSNWDTMGDLCRKCRQWAVCLSIFVGTSRGV